MANNLPPSSAEAPARFVITGPSGWIGRALLAMLHKAGDVDALVAGESVKLFGSRAASLPVTDKITLDVAPLSDMRPEDVAGAHVIHLAFLTKDKVDEVGVTKFRAINSSIDETLLAALSKKNPTSLFVASSGAAQQAESGIDRNPYGLAKLEQEERFLQYAQSNKVPTLCGRIFNIAGPHINKLEAYAVSNFTLQALRRGEIRVNAQNPVFRSFLHIHDLCRIILRAARERLDRSGPVDLCGIQKLEMQDIAEFVARAIGKKTRVERAHLSSSKPSIYLGNSAEIQNLARHLQVTTQEVQVQIQDTIDWIRTSFIKPTKLAERHALLGDCQALAARPIIGEER